MNDVLINQSIKHVSGIPDGTSAVVVMVFVAVETIPSLIVITGELVAVVPVVVSSVVFGC